MSPDQWSTRAYDNSESEQQNGARALLCKVLYKMENNNNKKSIYINKPGACPLGMC